MTLAETQALFHEAITSGEPLPDDRLLACFSGTPALPAADRVAIYVGMYLARLTDALAETFPRLARLLGEERFAILAAEYLRRHPSRRPDIGQAGRRLPAFLRRHPDPERPDLADLAALDWARVAVFFAPPAAPAGSGAFAGLAPEAFAGATLALSPALRRLRLAHDVLGLWRALEDGLPTAPPSDRPADVAVWRTGYEVFHARLPPDEARALALAAGGAPLAEVCGAFTGTDAAASAHAALSGWLAEGWIQKVNPG